MHWESYSHQKIKEVVSNALKQNLDYREKPVLGLPASYLDPEVFYDDAPFLKDAPFLSTLIANPNHIGCHTLNESEAAFTGTHQIERELIDLCAKEIFEGGEEDFDGYVASGGTEANIQAIWILKRYYEIEFEANANEVAVLYSEDAHYSMPKACRLLGLKSYVTKVDEETRRVTQESLIECIKTTKESGVKHFIVIMSMSTTMFGSVDDIDEITGWLDDLAVDYKVHIDGAYGGFIYPFLTESKSYTFENPKINSFTLDGHKMLQSPYGTGIYLTRKGFMEYALTEEANYVKGKDYTLVGSRSGANAVAVWMIMRTYGSAGWKAKIEKLQKKTDRLCSNLDERGVEYFRNPDVNIVTIKSKYITPKLAEKYLLVPDAHGDNAKWFKIVVMDHVQQGLLDRFLLDLDAELQTRK
ncbi:cytochrome D ubiquinol oxidase subunit I [Roseivirga spongicola]|uniref:Cytochrome D ubiquinol oxidase subunit I n=1 Tax=Roseivirga spongicola TaxID=333140 RepID=A0A150XGC9_9BACT|nr:MULTISPECIES: aminotransferase class I/II-fold pyridoxal phosphate-dependent enzyme [Roseivirga]KYG77787.1 cytochrome D ubiquinol oxidase subunit I [Roseivirga spongicola]MBO6661403.1 aspartate aminotransferase family protein [Roseivirga sp.]MBO6760238.1 aspartate aminotransferase family protein [Roseivirga sp.]MBO6908613.1 aspartate aminotransferase family protein [Roseivirga sp.]